MAKYQAIGAASNAVRPRSENAALDSEWSNANLELLQADKLQNQSSATKRRVFATRLGMG
jgi:hypothetical protein